MIVSSSSHTTNNHRVFNYDGQIRFPDLDRTLNQNEEWCEIQVDGHWKRIRFHDYDEVYKRPGLYEYLFYNRLACRSPEIVVRQLLEVCEEFDRPPSRLRVLELGAGNGMVAERLRSLDINAIAGIDIIPEAKLAAERDRPRVYDTYLVLDLTKPTAEETARLQSFAPTCLLCVAALGFGDIPPRAYYNALNLIAKDGLVAFNIKSEFLNPQYAHGFSALIRKMIDGDVLRVEAMRRYRHRISTNGDPLFYTAMIATKLKDVPESMLIED